MILIIIIIITITIPFPKSITNILRHHFKIHVSKVHYGSAVPFGQALPDFLITAHHLCAFLM